MKKTLKIFIVAASSLVLISAVAILFFDDMPKSRSLGDSQAMVRGALLGAYTVVGTAAVPKPDGDGCTSLEAGIQTITRSSSTNFWISQSGGSNWLIHINPDWRKWLAASTNDLAFTNEIAAYATPAIHSMHTADSVFFSISFGGQILELTNLPAWPPVLELLRKMTNSAIREPVAQQ